MYRSLLAIERETVRPCVRAHVCDGKRVRKLQNIHQEREKEKERKKERKKDRDRERGKKRERHRER